MEVCTLFAPIVVCYRLATNNAASTKCNFPTHFSKVLGSRPVGCQQFLLAVGNHYFYPGGQR